MATITTASTGLNQQELEIRLYELTKVFVQKYVHRYYKQFTGDIEDLVGEYFLSFMTKKSRVKGNEQNLIDKFDPSVTCFEYLVKVAVQRKLIDSSRSNPYSSSTKSIEAYTEEFGDHFMREFGLTTESEEDISEIEFTPTFKKQLLDKFMQLSVRKQNSIKKSFAENEMTLSENFRDLFQSVFDAESKAWKSEVTFASVHNSEVIVNYPVYQITDKTVCLGIDGEVVNFNRETGICKSPTMKCMKVTDNFLTTAEVIKPVTNKESFIREMC